MRIGFENLQSFYETPLGEMVRAQVAGRVEALWPDVGGLDMLGVGYCEPIVAGFRGRARRVVSAAPDRQGAVPWPESGPNCVVRVEEDRLPFGDAVFDRVVVSHGLEEAESPQRLLRELWRVSAPEARILLIVTNRRGIWSRVESTPMGHGRPFSRRQLDYLLEVGLFQPTASTKAIYAPPINWKMIASSGDAWEKIGKWVWPGFSGLIMIEAIKREYAEPNGGHRLRVKRQIPAVSSSSSRRAVDSD